MATILTFTLPFIRSFFLSFLSGSPEIGKLCLFPVHGSPEVGRLRVFPVHGSPEIGRLRVFPVQGSPEVGRLRVFPVHDIYRRLMTLSQVKITKS